MRGKGSVDIMALGRYLYNDPGKIEAMGLNFGQLIAGQVSFEANRPERVSERSLIQFPFCLLRPKSGQAT